MKTNVILALLLSASAPMAQAVGEASRKFGTAVEWDESVDQAAAKAGREDKLVLVLHVAGHFDRDALT